MPGLLTQVLGSLTRQYSDDEEKDNNQQDAFASYNGDAEPTMQIAVSCHGRMFLS